MNIAISDENGEATFFVTSDDAYNGLKDTHRKSLRGTVRVQTRTLDDWVESSGIPVIGLVKIDVEGLEHQVIRGALRTIDRHRPIVVSEIFRGTDSNASPEATIQTFVDRRYEAFVIENGLLRPFIPPHRDEFCNYVFIPADLARLPVDARSV